MIRHRPLRSIYVGANPISAIGDVLSSVVDRIPGSDWVKETSGDAAKSIGDFAKTPLGFHVLSTISSGGLYGALLPVIGPFAVVITTATPGLVAGEDFTTAYTKGLVDSLGKLAFALGAVGGVAGLAAGSSAFATIQAYKQEIEDKLNNPELRSIMDQAAAEAKKRGITLRSALDRLGITPEGIAKKIGGRGDAIAHAMNGLAHEEVADPKSFDVLTGAKIIAVPGGKSDGKNSAWALIDLLEVQKSGAAPDVIASSESDYKRALSAEMSPSPASPADLLTELLIAQNRGARGPYVDELQQKFEIASAREVVQKRQAADQAAAADRQAVLVDAARRGDFGVRLPPDNPSFVARGGPQTIAGVLGEILVLGVITAPAWATWLLLRRRR